MKEADAWWLRVNNGDVIVIDDDDDGHENVGSTVAASGGTAAQHVVVAGDREAAAGTGMETELGLGDERAAEAVAPVAGAERRRHISPRSGNCGIDEEISGGVNVLLREGRLRPRKRKATTNLQVDGAEVERNTAQSPNMSSASPPPPSDDLTPRVRQMPEGQWTFTHVSRVGKPERPEEVAKKVGTVCGVLSRKVNINIEKWTDVSASQKESLWDDFQEKFKIPEVSKEALKTFVLKKVNNTWKNFKHNLIKKFVKKGISPLKYYECLITEADWNSFVEAKQTEGFQELSKKQSSRVGVRRNKDTTPTAPAVTVSKNPRNKELPQRKSVEHNRYPVDGIKEVSLNSTKNKRSVSSSEKAEKYPFRMGIPFGNTTFIESLTKPCLTLHMWYLKRTNEEIHLQQSIVAYCKEKHFLHGDSNLTINFDDLYCLFHFDALDTSLLRCWTLYMMDEAENIGASVGFLDPGSITNDEIQRKIEDVAEYIFQVMVHNRDKHYILGAYNFSYHWILIVIDLKRSTVAYMDSKNIPSNELDPIRNCINRAFEMYAQLEGQSYGKSRLSHRFHFPCHTQPDGNNHCGFYVSHHMQQFVTSMLQNLEKFNIPRSELRKADFVSIRGRLCSFIYRDIITEDGQFHPQGAY